MDLAALLPWPELRTVVAAPADAKLRETADKIDAVRMTLHRREAEAQRREGATTTTTGGSRTQVDDVLLAGYTFVDSIRLKNWLDWLEVEDTEYDCDEGSLEAKSVEAECIRCEFLLWKLNAATPLRYNPFLSYWVEFHQRWASGPEAQSPPLKTHCIRLRLAVVDWILAGKDIAVLERLVIPESSSALIKAAPKPESIDLAPFIRMLQEEGIYDPPEEPIKNEQQLPARNTNGYVGGEAGATQSRQEKGKNILGIDQTGLSSSAEASSNTKRGGASSQPEYIAISQLLIESPAAARDIVHRPADLPTLELMTQLISTHAFEIAGIDKSEVVRQFIQHKLRLLEGAHDEEGAGFNGSNGNGGSSLAAPAPPRDEQQRIVALLILFMRNLIRKGHIAPEEIFFEIQEICTRFIWIREVREFQTFVEGGAPTSPPPAAGGGGGAGGGGQLGG